LNKNNLKGKRFEYETRDFFISLGFKETIVSGSESTNADNLGVDLLNLPFIVQCKNGYEKNKLKYLEIINHITKKIKNTRFDNQDVFIFHKITRKTFVIMSEECFLKRSSYKEVKNFEYFEKLNVIKIDKKDFEKLL